MKKGIYILPFLFTALNLSLGFYSILCVFQSKFSNAAWAIIACHFCDILDGWTARATKTSSAFGVEFDSFADWISFGIAPAIIMYQLVLNKLGKLGLALALFYILSGALRLARFNIRTFESKDIIVTHFTGLPIPAAGGMIASFVLVYELFYQEITDKTLPLVMKNIPIIYNMMPFIMFFLAVMMVSGIKWNKFKNINFTTPKPLQMFVLGIVFLLLIYSYTENVIFLLYISYIIWGLAGFLLRIKKIEKRGDEVGKQQGYCI